jgi:hypothetical protein
MNEQRCVSDRVVLSEMIFEWSWSHKSLRAHLPEDSGDSLSFTGANLRF